MYLEASRSANADCVFNNKKLSTINKRLITRLTIAVCTLLTLTVSQAVRSEENQQHTHSDWQDITAQAKGETLYFNTWGGDPKINRYIQWTAEQLKKHHNITLKHVKLADTAEAISRILAEKQANNTDNGSVDLMWINGENFATLKSANLLYGPWTETTPNFKLTGPDKNPAAVTDFTIATDGYELPWGKAQLIFFYDRQYTQTPPKTIQELLPWAKLNPGQFTYPKPPQFLGTTFLKQTLIELVADKERLYSPVNDADFMELTTPLFEYLDALHPTLWRKGKNFPSSGPELKNLLADGEISVAFSFNIQEVASSIANYELPESVTPYLLESGTLGNYNFLAIPFNAPHKSSALITANFLLSPFAQARKQDPKIWGSTTVLDFDALNTADKALFNQKKLPGLLPLDAVTPALPEPHPSWVTKLEQTWLERYQQ